MKTNAPINRRFPYLAYGILAQLVPGTIHGAQPLKAHPFAQAQAGSQLLRQADARLRGAKTLVADFTSTEAYSGQYKDLLLQGQVVLARPRKWRIETKRFRRVQDGQRWEASGNNTLSVSDGTTHFREFIHPTSVQARQDPAKAPAQAVSELPLLSAFYGEGLSAQARSVRLAKPQIWDDQAYKAVEFEVSSEPGRADQARALIGADGLIHRLTYRRKTARGVTTKEWILRNVRLGQAVGGKTFVYTPRKEALPLLSAPRQELLAPGDMAPDFTVFDASGKAVSLADYRGKTVVLDFWATWCWPCNQSLPFTARSAQRYRERDVVVLAVAIWDTKDSFVHWLHKHTYPSIQFAVDPQPQGEDIASTLYKVSARPTVYIINPSGHIVSSVVGFSGEATEKEISKAIEQAVAQK